MPDILEANVPLSESLIWRLQREFYQQRGLKVWTEDRIPEYITNNPFISEIYASIVYNFLSECMKSGQKEEPPVSKDRPLRILEMGAGHGKFCYLFLKRLMALYPDAAVRYFLTDCSEALLDSWRSNPYLAEFVQSGVLEFELLQAGATLAESIRSKIFGSPLVVIASYIFDSLPQDAFIIQDGKVLEALVTVKAKNGKDGAPPQLSDLQLSYTNVGVSPRRYADESWNHILEWYRAQLGSASVLFPCSALRMLQELGSLSNGNMLVLAADKGFVYEEDLYFSQGQPSIGFPSSTCFSLIVNLDAIAKSFRGQGGKAFLPDKHIWTLNICGFLQCRPDVDFLKTQEVFRVLQEAFGPDDLFTLFAWLNPHMEQMSVPQILAALRLTRWDPVAFVRLFPVLVRQFQTISTERQDLRNAVLRTWENHYPLNTADNELAFQCGVVLLELRFFEEAMAMFRKSEQIVSRSAATSYNMGLCAIGLGRTSEALAFMDEACKQDPNFEPARLSRARLEAELKNLH